MNHRTLSCAFTILWGTLALAVVPAHGAETLYVRYGTAAETAYTNIVVENGKLIYKHVNPHKRFDPHNMAQRPQWTDSDLVAETADLTPSEIAQLIQLIRQTGFLRLHIVYGPTKIQRRYYPAGLTVKLDKRSKTVAYHSGLQSSPMPEAFKKLMERLYALKKSHFSDR